MEENKDSKMGRPPKAIDWKIVDNMCAIQCTCEEIADVIGMSTDTLVRNCKKEYGLTFAEYFKKNSANGKMSLRRKQFSVAMKGSIPMLIWLGKNYLGQSDKIEGIVGMGTFADLIKKAREKK